MYPLKWKYTFYPKKETLFYEIPLDFLIIKIKQLCYYSGEKVFHFFLMYFTCEATLKSILQSLQSWQNFNIFLNPKIKVSFREM